MSLKKLFVLILLVGLAVSGLDAVERREPIPMSELTNPKSPSYVPIPYPQTDEELLVDVKYFMERSLPRKTRDFTYIDHVFNDFFKGKVLLGEIIRVKNKLAYREKDYTLLVRLKTIQNCLLGNISFDANGLWLGHSIVDLKRWENTPLAEKLVFKKYSDLQPVAAIIKNKIWYDLNDNELQRIQLVDCGSSLGNNIFPCWEIPLQDGSTYILENPAKALPQRLLKSTAVLNSMDPNYKTQFKQLLINQKKDGIFFYKTEDVDNATVVFKVIGE